jgi:hypothetical protein
VFYPVRQQLVNAILNGFLDFTATQYTGLALQCPSYQAIGKGVGLGPATATIGHLVPALFSDKEL